VSEGKEKIKQEDEEKEKEKIKTQIENYNYAFPVLRDTIQRQAQELNDLRAASSLSSQSAELLHQCLKTATS